MLNANVQTAPVDRLAGLNPICGSYRGSVKETAHRIHAQEPTPAVLQ